MVAACLGLFMRYMTSFAVPGVTFGYILHAHSHVMFLGWIFNMLVSGFMKEFCNTKPLRISFWLMQVPMAGILLSFPLQGYAFYSILFSSLHTIISFVFIGFYVKATVGRHSLALQLSKASLLFFVIASIAPFYVGYLKAQGLEHTDLYRFAIYFYLHFQYNGCFFFGALSLFINLFEIRMSPGQLGRVRSACLLYFTAAFPAYALSMLWASPGLMFNVVGFLAGVIQILAFVLMTGPLRAAFRSLSPPFTSEVNILVATVAILLAAKLVLQLLSPFEALSIMANEYRSIVIAYLHLMLVGVITLFLFAWLVIRRIASSSMTWGTYVLMAGFAGSELLLILTPLNGQFSDATIAMINHGLLFFSSLMVAGMAVYLRRTFHVLPGVST